MKRPKIKTKELRLKWSRRRKDRKKFGAPSMRLSTFADVVYGVDIPGDLGVQRLKMTDSHILDLIRAVFI